MPDNAQQIATLKRVLASGASSVTVDGVSTQYRSRDDILKEISRLEHEDVVNGYTDATNPANARRPIKTINLGNF